MRLVCFLGSRDEQTELTIKSLATQVGFACKDVVFSTVRKVSETRLELNDITMLYVSIEEVVERKFARNALTYLLGKNQTPLLCLDAPSTTAESAQIEGEALKLLEVIGHASIVPIFGGTSYNLRTMFSLRRQQYARNSF